MGDARSFIDHSSIVNIHRLGVRIIRDFNAIDPVAQPRNVAAWTPVITEILQGCEDFEPESVSCKTRQVL